VSKHDKRQEQVVRGLKVEVRNNDVGFALRKFKKKIQEDGIMQELRGREFLKSPV